MRLGLWCVIVAGAWSTLASGAQSFEHDVLAELNRARTDPRGVAQDLRLYRDSFAGRIVHEDGDPIGVMTVEGARAVTEAIAFLDAQEPLPPLDAGPVLARAAKGWAVTQGPTGGLGHGGAPGDRVRAAGGDVYVGETIAYGARHAAAVVRQLIVDDGVPQRGHRAMVFARDMRFAGVGCAGHARFGSMCVVDYAATPDGGAALTQVAAAQPSRAIAFNR